MTGSIWVLTLIAVTAVSLPAQGKDCCPCPSPKREARAADQNKGVPSHPISGGKSPDQAVAIEPNRIYKINHVVKKGQRAYFSLPSEPGTELTLAIKSMKKTDVGFEAWDHKARSVATLSWDGEANEVRRVSWKPLVTGPALLAIGSDREAVGKGQVIFKAEAVLAPVECAAGGDPPLPLGPDAPREDCFWKDNTVDRFRFEGQKKGVSRIEVVSGEGSSAGLRARVGLEQKKKSPKILADVSGSGGRVAIESVALPKKGSYILEVELLQATADVLPYTVSLTGAAIGSPSGAFAETQERIERAPRRHRHRDRPYY